LIPPFPGSNPGAPAAHVDNVCHALEHRERSWRRSLFRHDGADSTLKEVISGLLQTRGIEPPRASAPLPVAWVMASVMEWIWRNFSRQGEPPMTRQMLRLIGEPFTLDIGKARRELGYQPVISRELGLKAMQAT
jgi:nucleoside-diphosphate-sugar epimerase